MEHKNKEIVYAGFFTRLLATVVDIFIISLILSIVTIAIDTKSILIVIVVWWLYNTVMLIKWKATIGGKLFGIEVLNSELEPLSFKSASYRFILSITPFVLYILIRGIQHDMVLAPSPTIQQLPQLLFFLPPLLMFFTQKKQMIHDLLVHSIVVDKSEIKHAEKEEKKSVLYVGRKILRIIGTLVFLILAGYLAIYVGVFYTLAKQSHDTYNASFEHNYTVNDYNDSRIIFYNQELETNSQKLIEAKGMYEIFEADVKNDLALNCIEYFLAREHNESDWIEMGSGFRKNARNKYANTEAMIEKAKKNEDHMGKYFYYYDLNDVNHLVNNIADKWKKDANTETCQKMLPVDQMYTMFVVQYIKNREEALERDKREYQYAKPSGMLNKSFYKKEIEETSAWLEMLYEKNPKLLIEKKKQKAKIEKEYQEILKKEKANKIAAQKRKVEIYKNELVAGKDPLLLALHYGMNEDFEKLLASGVNLENKGQNGFTPLFYASHPKNTYAVKKLLDAGADMYAMSNRNIYSAFTWAVSNQNIDTVQLFLDHGVDVNYQNNKSETALTIAAKGCKNFEMVQLLLENGADPELIDTYGQNTISGLFRYCKENENYTKMLDLLKRYR